MIPGREKQISVGNSMVDAVVFQAPVLLRKKRVVVGKCALCVWTEAEWVKSNDESFKWLSLLLQARSVKL